MRVHVKHGLRLKLPGAPVVREPERKRVAEVAILGLDLIGVKPELLVGEGDRVRAGEAVFRDRKRPAIHFTAPASGTVTAIHRGSRRKLKSVVLSITDDAPKTFETSPNTASGLRTLLCESGMWSTLRARPFGRIPDPDAEPLALLVTATDFDPLAPDPAHVIEGFEDDFRRGLEALTQITPAPVYLCTAPGAPMPDVKNVRVAEFSGSFAAGLPGTHIHQICPVAWDASGEAWHIDYQSVIAIGHLLRTAQVWGERVVALAGPQVETPRLLLAPAGANLVQLTDGELIAGPARIVSGSALTGRAAYGAQAYLGHGNTQVTVLNEDRKGHRGGTLMGGGPGPILPMPAHDATWPFDIPIAPLLRALAVGDVETVDMLGGRALAEEDLAAVSYVCPSKSEYGALLRRVLDQLAKGGA